MTEDTTEGVHDTLIAACDRARYVELGGGEGHRNCTDNLIEALEVLGLSLFSYLSTPHAWGLFFCFFVLGCRRETDRWV